MGLLATGRAGRSPRLAAGGAATAALPGVLGAVVCGFVAGSSSVAAIAHAAHATRFALLAGLFVVAAVAAVGTDRFVLPVQSALAAGGFCGLALLSAFWSVDARLTAERAASLTLLFATTVLLCAAAWDRPVVVERLLRGVLAACVVVTVAGLVLLVVAYHDAVQPASYEGPWRYRGLGQDPNTVPLLIALAVPLALREIAQSGSKRWRWFGVGSLLLIVGSIVASGSRGGLAGAVVGALLFVIVSRSPRRVVAVLALVVAAGLCAAIQSLPRPTSVTAAAATTVGSSPTRPAAHAGYQDAEAVYPLSADVGRPLPGGGEQTLGRSYFGSGGRSQAWVGALHLIAQRPLTGFGFGTEGRVFVERYYFFIGGLPENSYIGITLQLGILGLIGLIGLVVTLVRPGLRAVHTAPGGLVAACLGVLAAGLVMAVVQSYVYSVGNIASSTLWTAGFLLPALAAEPRRPKRSLSLARLLVAASVVVLLVAVVPFARWERSRQISNQLDGMGHIAALVGPIDNRTLSGFRILPGFDCLTYRRGSNPFALELCFDSKGRVVQAIDRRTTTRHIASLQAQPSASTITINYREAIQLVHMMEK